MRSDPPPARDGHGDRWRRLDAPDSVWNRAAAAEWHGDPFCSRSEWQLSCHEAFEPERTLHLVDSGDSVVALALHDEPGLGPLLGPLDSHWYFGCPLLGPHAVDLLADLVDDLARAGDAPGVLVSGLHRDRPRFHELLTRFALRSRMFAVESVTLCSASLEGGLEGFLSRRSPSLRRNLRRAGARAAREGVTWERAVPRTAGDVSAAYARMLAVEARSWKGIGACGMAEPPAREFYEILLGRLAPAGAARVIFARHADRDIGFIFGSLAGDVYRGQQFSYDEDWHALSLGNLMQVEQVRWLCEHGAARYDMGPLMDYKSRWTETETRLETVLIVGRGAARRAG